MPTIWTLSRSLAVAAALSAAPGQSFAQCAAPAPPDAATRPTKPVVPVKSPCVDAKPGTEGCKGWEVYSFNDEVKAYNSKLPAYKAAAETYVAALNAYVAASAEYARCEVKALQ
jgi:hypothetical protein